MKYKKYDCFPRVIESKGVLPEGCHISFGILLILIAIGIFKWLFFGG